MQFREILTDDGVLATYSCGEGPAVIFLHGGPGDTHHYLRPVTRKLSPEFRCILFDQRGSGRSALKSKDQNTLNLAKFILDIDAVCDAYEVAHPLIFGHSWGAMLGLFYNIARPNVAKSALVSMGPLTREYGEHNGTKLLSALDSHEKEQWNQWRKERNHALAEGNAVLVQHFDNQMMRLRIKSWVHQPHLRQAFLEDYFADPPVERLINKLVWESLPENFDFTSLESLQNPVLLCQGRQDANPLAQLEKLARGIPNSESFVLDECGHIPWLEHPETFYKVLRRFLSDNIGA